MDEENDSDGSTMEVIARLGVRFKIPLESAGVDLSQLQEEFHEMISYAAQFISISTIEYQSVWWRLSCSNMLHPCSDIDSAVKLLGGFAPGCPIMMMMIIKVISKIMPQVFTTIQGNGEKYRDIGTLIQGNPYSGLASTSA